VEKPLLKIHPSGLSRRHHPKMLQHLLHNELLR
jgi:hypothetical protein